MPPISPACARSAPMSLNADNIAKWRSPAMSGSVTRVEPAPAAALFRSLGDPNLLAILRRLAIGEARVGELVDEVALAQSTVSKHLACLKECGLVDSEPVGRASMFRLSQPALVDLLAAAETVLQAGGQAVALCPSYGMDSCAGDSDERWTIHRRRG